MLLENASTSADPVSATTAEWEEGVEMLYVESLTSHGWHRIEKLSEPSVYCAVVHIGKRQIEQKPTCFRRISLHRNLKVLDCIKCSYVFVALEKARLQASPCTNPSHFVNARLLKPSAS